MQDGRFARRREEEGGARVDRALRPDAAAVAVHDALHRGEADSGAFEVARRMQPLEHAEQFRRIGHIEAGAIVADGVDGLAGMLGLMSSALFGIYFYMNASGMEPYYVLAFSLCGSLIAFLIFNFQPAKIFMGDTGSLLVGVVNAILVLKFIDPGDGPESVNPIVSSPAIGFTVLMIPLLDTLRVFAIRIFKRRSPFSPDRNHIHHLLLDRGLSHRTITLLLVAINVSMVVFVYLARSLGCTILILSVIAIFFSFIAIAYYSRSRDSLTWETDGIDKNEKVKESKLVTFIRDSMLEQKN